MTAREFSFGRHGSIRLDLERCEAQFFDGDGKRMPRQVHSRLPQFSSLDDGSVVFERKQPQDRFVNRRFRLDLFRGHFSCQVLVPDFVENLLANTRKLPRRVLRVSYFRNLFQRGARDEGNSEDVGVDHHVSPADRSNGSTGGSV